MLILMYLYTHKYGQYYRTTFQTTKHFKTTYNTKFHESFQLWNGPSKFVWRLLLVYTILNLWVCSLVDGICCQFFSMIKFAGPNRLLPILSLKFVEEVLQGFQISKFWVYSLSNKSAIRFVQWWNLLHKTEWNCNFSLFPLQNTIG
jgi:hypothetical protein